MTTFDEQGRMTSTHYFPPFDVYMKYRLIALENWRRIIYGGSKGNAALRRLHRDRDPILPRHRHGRMNLQTAQRKISEAMPHLMRAGRPSLPHLQAEWQAYERIVKAIRAKERKP